MSTYQFSTNTKAFMEAVQEVRCRPSGRFVLQCQQRRCTCREAPDWQPAVQTAGPKSGINTIDKVVRAVDTGKVLLALNSVSGILKVRARGSPARLRPQRAPP